MAIILESNAIIDPWTMMVHFQDTAITARAVMCSWWFIVVACFTESWCMC
jgi:hypothetical protein